jgi:lysophospholipase L1-like esterase
MESYILGGHLVVNNKYGFRERDFDIPDPKVYRIMVLGDSLTWGAGLDINERYTNLAESYLNQAFPERKFEVLNFGLSGGATTAERDVLRKYKDLVKPNRIVVGFCLNDTQPKSQDYTLEREEFNKKYGPFLAAIPLRFKQVGLPYLGFKLKDAVYGFAEIAGIIPRWQVGIQRTYEKTSKEWTEFEQALKDIKAMSDEMKLPAPIFAVLNQGTYTDRPTDYSHPDEELKIFLQWYHQAEEAASKVGFKTYNHEKEIILQLPNKNLAVNVVDGHPSKELNQIYAKKLFDVIAHDEEALKLFDLAAQ